MHSFHKVIIQLNVILMAVLFTGLPKDIFGQKLQSTESTEGEVGFFCNFKEQDNRAFYAQFLYIWWFNKYIGCSAGAMVLKAKQLTGNFHGSWTVGDTYYTFSNPLIHLNAVGEFRVAVPLVWKFGLTLNARFMFEPIPLDVISYEVYPDMKPVGNHTQDGFTYTIYDSDKVSHEYHYVFTRFNLSGIINAGLYFDYKKLRITLGYGRGSYDAYNSYRYATIDGHSMAEHAPPSSSRYISNVFLSLTIFN